MNPPGATSVWRDGRSPRGEDVGITEFLVLSALMLFWEICLIRWISTEIRVFAYYKNLSLLAAFLGFGIGLLTSRNQRNWLRSCVGWLGLLILVVVVYPVTPLRIEAAPAFFQEFTWQKQLSDVGTTLKFYTVVLGIFGLNAAAFVPWGRRIGFYFDRLRPIPAYSMNILANLCGIVLFSVLSVLGAPPLAWVIVGFAPLFLLRPQAMKQPIVLAATLIAVTATGVQFVAGLGTTYWSPYYKITVEPPSGDGSRSFHTLRVNQDYHQRILDLRPDRLGGQPEVMSLWSLAYGLPYEVGTPTRVLVIGAGTGNDVAAALRYGARHVTAVEIDPLIYRIGKRLHPEQPYSARNVDVIVSDARTYLANPPDNEPFDIIVFGLLDSHTQVSGMTSLRLDNFVYTRESFAQAKQLLHPDHGLMAVSFSAAWNQAPWTLRRIHRMLSDVFGTPPTLAFTGYDQGVSFLSGPATPDNPYFETDVFGALRDAAYAHIDQREAATEHPATDDWPFLYLERRTVPREYTVMIVLIVLLAAAWVTLASGRHRTGPFSLHFFLLGGAFLLIEVRNLVAFSLTFGSTWQVNNLAIGGILVMILLANLVAARVRKLNGHLLYGALLASLVLGVFLGAEDFQGTSGLARLVILPLWLSLPIFCAGLVFIRSFSRTAYPAGALGANIIGGICGGLLENLSLAFGIDSLQYIAIALYGLSWIAMVLERRT